MKAHPILTTFHRVNVYTSHSQSSGATTTSVRHTYTVHCHDGRKFVFKPPHARVQDLGESIEVQVARMKQFMSQGQPAPIRGKTGVDLFDLNAECSPHVRVQEEVEKDNSRNNHAGNNAGGCTCVSNQLENASEQAQAFDDDHGPVGPAL